MQTTESCHLCEKIVIVLESKEKLTSLSELPSTRDERQGKYVWRHTDLMSYALVPRAVQGTTGLVDFYLCIEEDDMDDIDVLGYAKRFFRETILPAWKNGKDVHLMQPSLSPPVDLDCWKLRHAAGEGAA